MTDAAASTERALAERVARRLGRPVTAWRGVAAGYTAAARLILTFADGGSAFVKGATDAQTASWLRAESSIYSFLPREPELAALMSGFFAARAGLPAVDVRPSVRALQRAQLGVALPWAVDALGLSSPDGAGSRDVR